MKKLLASFSTFYYILNLFYGKSAAHLKLNKSFCLNGFTSKGRKLLFIAISLLTVTTTSSQAVIKGQIYGLSKVGVDSLFLYDFLGGSSVIDSCVITGDSFQFAIGRVEPAIYSINAKAKRLGLTLWIDNKDLDIRGKIQDVIINDENVKFLRVYSGIVKKGSLNQQLHDSFFGSIMEDLAKYYNPPPVIVLRKGEQTPFDSVRSRIRTKCQKFIMRFPDRPVSAFILFYLRTEDLLSQTDTHLFRSLLSKQIQESLYGKLIVTEFKDNEYKAPPILR